MTSDLCPEAAVVHITTPQIITSESLVCVGGGAGAAAGVRGPPAAGGSAVELGRRLLLAARAGDTPLVLDLMAKGAPFTTDWLGTSPLHLAAGNAHVETCGVLLRAGVSRDSRTKVERTPLHLAAHAGHAAVAALLLEHGALVDCRDMLRMTPLHWAAERGHAACCGVLLRHGADARALSKFHKTPAQLAAAKGHDHVRALIDDALRQREAARAGRELRALQLDRSADEATEPQRPAVASVQKIQDIKIKAKPVQEKAAKVETKTESAFEQAGSAGGGPGAAAALLRRHGITLLPADDGSTLLNALQSGRTVVLSDAGKLMLKECGSPAAGAASPTASSASARARGVVLTCAPVRAPPPGVRVFALNNRRAPAAAPAAPAPAAVTAHAPRRITLADNQQVKFVQLPADARVVSPRKATRVRRVTGSVAAAAAGTRPPVKIIMNKSNFERLVAGARRDSAAPDATPPSAPAGLAQPEAPAAPDGTEEAEPVQVGAESSDDPAALGAALAAAQRAVARLTGELQQVRARLAHYEPA